MPQYRRKPLSAIAYAAFDARLATYRATGEDPAPPVVAPAEQDTEPTTERPSSDPKQS